MRKIVQECRTIGSTPIEDIVIDPRMRDDLSAVLKGLQQVYCNAESKAELFKILETHVQPGTRKDVGMDLWRVLVFAIVKQCLDLDYDALLYRANHDALLRDMLGHGYTDFDPVSYTRQRLVDNVQQWTPELINKVIALVVRTGHAVAGKKYGAALRGRCDSRVVKTHVHWPTDVRLLWDATRGLIRACAKASAAFAIPGWRTHADRSNKVYAAFCTAPRYRKNRTGVKAYVRLCQTHVSHAKGLLDALAEETDSAQAQAAIRRYVYYVTLLADQVHRRGETIPQKEKVFSIHKPHTRWINKGKAGVPAELGIPVAVVEDVHPFILGYQSMWKESDVDVAVPLTDAVQAVYPSFEGCSFDRGFYSATNRAALDERLVLHALPKKGPRTAADRDREGAPAFREARRPHPAIESCLANFGLRGGALVREKSPEPFALMVGLSVLAVNVHRLGCLVRNRERVLHARQRKRAA